MARYDVFQTVDGAFFVDVRADAWDALGNYVLIPLVALGAAGRPIGGLNPIVDVCDEPYVALTQLVSAAPRSQFGEPVDNLDRYWHEFTRALDLLFTGI